MAALRRAALRHRGRRSVRGPGLARNSLSFLGVPVSSCNSKSSTTSPISRRHRGVQPPRRPLAPAASGPWVERPRDHGARKTSPVAHGRASLPFMDEPARYGSGLRPDGRPDLSAAEGPAGASRPPLRRRRVLMVDPLRRLDRSQLDAAPGRGPSALADGRIAAPARSLPARVRPVPAGPPFSGDGAAAPARCSPARAPRSVAGSAASCDCARRSGGQRAVEQAGDLVRAEGPVEASDRRPVPSIPKATARPGAPRVDGGRAVRVAGPL